MKHKMRNLKYWFSRCIYHYLQNRFHINVKISFENSSDTNEIFFVGKESGSEKVVLTKTDQACHIFIHELFRNFVTMSVCEDDIMYHLTMMDNNQIGWVKETREGIPSGSIFQLLNFSSFNNEQFSKIKCCDNNTFLLPDIQNKTISFTRQEKENKWKLLTTTPRRKNIILTEILSRGIEETIGS